MNAFKGRHFTGIIILWAVRWYCKYGISYREFQEMLAERGVNVDHTIIYRLVGIRLENGKYPTLSLFFIQKGNFGGSGVNPLTIKMSRLFVLMYVTL